MAAYTGPPMSLGVRAVMAQCRACGREASVAVDRLGDAVFVPDVARALVCSTCGGRRIETRPDWSRMRRGGMG